MDNSIQNPSAGAAGQSNPDVPNAAQADKGKGKMAEEMPVDDSEEDDEDDENEGEAEEADDDNMEEIDTENVMSSRTRNKDINWAEAAKNLPEDDEDDEDDGDFEDDDDKMED